MIVKNISKPVQPLSPCQKAVMQMLVDGMTIKEIVITQDRAYVTIKKHFNKAKKRLGARTREQAIAFAVASGEVIVNIERREPF